MKKIRILVICLSLWLLNCMIVLFMSGCTRLNDNPPAYIKSVVAYKEGMDGLAIYFILADCSGSMTTSNGKVNLIISETYRDYQSWNYKSIEKEIELFSISFDIKKTDFQKAKVGMGMFEREAILYPIGRIPYSLFKRKPSEMTGKIKLEFQIPDSQIFKGEETITF